MADSLPANAVQMENGEIGYLAPNHKSAVLQEVEDDATYITQKRIREHYEEQNREAEKLAREDAKNNPPALDQDPEAGKKGK